MNRLIPMRKVQFSIVMVDGSSKDHTVRVAKSFVKKIPKFKIIVSNKASLPLQRNLGAKEGRGEWFVFVDADSIFLPYFIERCRKFIAEKNPKLFTTWFAPDSENPKDSVYTLFGNIYLEMTRILNKPLSPGPLTLVRRDAYERVGGYDEMHAFHEDVDFGLRLFQKGIHVEMLREALCIWSLRRFRKEGTLKVLNQYVLGILPVLLMNRSVKRMPGYIMGGHLYEKKKPVKRSVLARYEVKLKKLMKELFE
ncbi:glycosyltransferase [Candidatus Gottesmanbacteria bacterium]|nr:glycosyltransferase [Candidatus Gottesmanbacteria bacterium]